MRKNTGSLVGVIGCAILLAIATHRSAMASMEESPDDAGLIVASPFTHIALETVSIDLDLKPSPDTSTSLISSSLTTGNLVAPDDEDLLDDESGGWFVTLTPYVWVPFEVDGSSTVGGVSVDIDLSLNDILDHFDVIGVTGLVEAKKKDSPWGFLAAGSYLSLDSEQFTRSTPFPIPPVLEIDVEVEQIQIDLALSYRLGQWSRKADEGLEFPKLTADLYFGGRYVSLKQRVNIRVGPFMTSVGGTEDWVEPTIGGKLEYEFSDSFSVMIGGAAGGFGIGSGSDLIANLVVGSGYRLKPHVQFRFEYQFYWIDYETTRSDGGFGMDTLMHGPWIGLSIDF